ncbi:MAG: sugar isomerase domain-containing protein [Bdellovibrionales bacterium]
MNLSPVQSDFVNQWQRVQKHILSQSSLFSKLGDLIAGSLDSGNVLHVFGSGHSHVIAEEMFHRAGGLVQVNAILEDYLMPHAGPSRVGTLERTPGVYSGIFKSHDFKSGEFLIISSNSGINAVSIEVAKEAKNLGLNTIAITSLTHSQAVPSRFFDTKLFEECDYVIDTGTERGDACVSVPGLEIKACPLSGVANLFIAQYLVANIIEAFTKRAKVPPIYQSANTPGGDEHNKLLEEQYKNRIQHLK